MTNCTIQRLHQEIKFRYNKLDSNHKQDLPPAYIDDMIYTSILDYIDMFYSANQQKIQRYGFEETQSRIDMLQSFVTEFKSDDDNIKLISTEDEAGFTLSTYSLDCYLHHVRTIAKTKCGYKSISIEQHDDVNLKLKSKFTQPDDKWCSVLATIHQDKLQIYSASPIEYIKGEYIKLPKKPFIGGYNTLEYINGDKDYPNASSDVIHPEFNANVCNHIARIAVINISDILQDYNHSTIIQNKLINNN